ncbi:MAG: UDP-N-acetylmuramate dehydrogenase, partial [Vicinamibacterales bacterium]
MALADELGAAFGARARPRVPLAPFTTFKVGGPADWFVEATGADDVRRAIALGHRAGVAVTMLGGGSNVLVADAGVRGIVIRVHGGGVR